MIYSEHAKERMQIRRISEEEVEYVHSGANVTSPGKTNDRVNVSGKTSTGRRIRLTVYEDQPDYVITVVVEEEA